MTKFKVGDKVQSLCPNAYSFKEKVVTVSSIIGDRFRTNDSLWDSYEYSMSNFKLIESACTHSPLYSEEAAVKLLIERGYEVKAPPGPLKGKVMIYQGNRSGDIFTASEALWNSFIYKEKWKLIAIVDWTEGQGI